MSATAFSSSPTLGVFGRGRLARAIEDTASGREQTPRWLLGRGETPDAPVDVAIDASVASAVEAHLDWALETGTDLVIAATGWHTPGGWSDELESRVDGRIVVVLAPNGSLGVALAERLTRILGTFARTWYGDDADGFLLDHHHAAKVDAPSGTARRLAAAWREGSGRDPAIAALRAGHEVGEHVVGLDAPGERLELTHRARSRETFAHGLLRAARWAHGRREAGGVEPSRRGVFTMIDVARDAFRGTSLAPLFDDSAPPSSRHDTTDRHEPTHRQTTDWRHR